MNIRTWLFWDIYTSLLQRKFTQLKCELQDAINFTKGKKVQCLLVAGQEAQSHPNIALRDTAQP